jgi:hypothetical protein
VLFLRILDYRDKLIKRHQISHGECLVVGIATSFAMDVATLKPYRESFVGAFCFRATVDGCHVELNHFQS